MYTITINHYKDLEENIDDDTFFSENVEFSENFDEFLTNYIVRVSELDLQGIRVEILRKIVVSMRSMKLGDNRLFMFCCSICTWAMWHRATVIGDSLLVEFEEIVPVTRCYV